ncbi:MAG TPA: tetratricopeptide repeat protein [Steroidobacteraceae bacterium]|jgi:lipopolysaccharide biosynthesis regulator YciM|nr:tetratricopeptide repeat protein [Steroidobacteraceae bacterium]
MIELSPLLLALAFIVVGAIAWGLGHGRALARTVRLPRDYYVGLDHLINDRFDRAAEVFARMAEVDGDAVEIQFALGSVFRRRGEVERAIAIHTRLRGDATPAVAQRGAFALALDYSSAGLMDRAERLFEELAATREYRHAALDHLVRIHEQAGDWANALKVFHELPSAVQSERRRVAAHYLCELAEHAVLQGEAARAQALLKQARAHDQDLPRAQLLSARMTAAAGDSGGALALYLHTLEAAPELALEIIPRVLTLVGTAGEAQLLGDLSSRLRATGRVSARQLAWLLATAVPAKDVTESSAEVSSLRALLMRMGDVGGRYQCDDCGLPSVGWYWRCPKCRAWDTLHPVVFKWAERTDEAARAL